MDHATMADWYYDESRDDRNEGFRDGESLGLDPEDELSPLELLRSTGPHAGLAALSAELDAAVNSLPKAQRVALAHRDALPRTAERYLEPGIAFALFDPRSSTCNGRPWSEAMKMAREALEETRGILDPINGKVTR